MKIASFNINGVKARLPALLDWLRDADADVVVLQEIKATDDQFPRLEIEDMGYAVETHGQKGFNGVALLSRLPLEDVRRGLPGDDGDEQARWIEALVVAPEPVRVCGLYLPNGNPAPGPKYDYKLAWMDRLHARVAALVANEEPAVVLGDYNVIPEPKDCWNAAVWQGDALYPAPDAPGLPPHRQPRPHRRAPRRRPGTGHLHLLGLPGRRLPEELGHPHRPRSAHPAGRGPPRHLRHRRRDPQPREAVRPRPDLGHARLDAARGRGPPPPQTDQFAGSGAATSGAAGASVAAGGVSCSAPRMSSQPS